MVAQTSWRRRAGVVAAMLLAGFGAQATAPRALLVAHVAAAASQAPASVGASIDRQAAPERSEASSSQCMQDLLEASPPYAADHLDAQFVDYAHPEPLSPESVREMALTQFLRLPSLDRQRHGSR